MAHQTFFKADMETRAESKAKRVTADDKAQRTAYAIVTARDERKCRVCKKRADPSASTLLERGHHHHIQFRSQGGADTPENLILVDRLCHDLIHVKRDLEIVPQDPALGANGKLDFYRRDPLTGEMKLAWSETVIGVSVSRT